MALHGSTIMLCITLWCLKLNTDKARTARLFLQKMNHVAFILTSIICYKIFMIEKLSNCVSMPAETSTLEAREPETLDVPTAN